MSIPEKLGARKSNFVGLIIVAAAVLYGLVSLIVRLVGNLDMPPVILVGRGLNIAVYLLILYFALFGYKVPNGKMLKYVYLLESVSLGLSVGISAMGHRYVPFILFILAASLAAFIGGRLPRVKENRINCALFLAIILAADITFTINVQSMSLDNFIQAAALVFAYHSRAAQYKENSGILDDK